MLIKYKFADGTITEIEVSDEIGVFILESRRAEHANNERHRYHSAFSIDSMVYEGKEHFSDSTDPEKIFIDEENASEREEAFCKLTTLQRRRFELFESGISIAEIARYEKTSFNSVNESIEAAQKKLKKIYGFFEITPSI